jgi:hypothetical protein
MLSLKKTVQNSTLQSILFGLIITVIIMIAWTPPFKKYNIVLNPFEHKAGYQKYHWIAGDFNGDGNSERIRCFRKTNSKTMDVVHYDGNGNLTDHWHIEDAEWNYRLVPKVFDIDNDGKQELLFFTVRNDSVFFNAFNLVTFKRTIKNHYFITIERKLKKDYAYYSLFNEFGDFDKDGNNELFFSFNAGYGLYPRGIFKIEFPSLKIIASPTEYMNVSFRSIKDLNGDGVPEILTACSAPDNTLTCKKYTDTMSYITVLNYDLSFLFPPIAMRDKFSSVNCIASSGDGAFFYALFFSRSDNIEPIKLMVINKKGEIINEKSWHNLSNTEDYHHGIKVINNTPYLFSRNIGSFKLTKTLENVPDELNPHQNNLDQFTICADLNEDGIDEWIFWDSKDRITIYNEKTNEHISFESPILINSIISIYPMLKNNRIKNYMFTTARGYFFLDYKKNEKYYLLYIIYILTFLVFTGSIRTILYYQKRNIEKRWQMEKQLSELQFNSVKNQLNPHFLFNALNSVAYLIETGQKEDAYNFLSLNSKLIQRVMDDAKEIKRPLDAEMDFTHNYLKIQEHRFKDRFKWEFIIGPEVNPKFEVPKMCIHTYVENAVKHGFRDIKGGGLLTIKVSALKSGIFIQITDNGIGRKAALKHRDSTGNGLKIMKEFFRLFEKYHGYKIQVNISDLNKGVIARQGTKVELIIQNKQDFIIDVV